MMDSTATDVGTRMSWLDHWPLVVIVLMAAVARAWQITESLWLDELHTAWVVLGAGDEFAQRAQIGNQSVLYFFLPWWTTRALGLEEWTLRLPSLLAGVALVAAAYGVTYRCTNSRLAASLVGLLAASDRNCLFFATEARSYALVQLLAVAQWFVFWQSYRSRRWVWSLANVLLSGLLFYLHYTAILLLAGQILYVAVDHGACWWRADDSSAEGRWRRQRARRFVVELAAIALLIAPAAWHVADIGSRSHAWTRFVREPSWTLPVHSFSLASYVAIPTALWFLAAMLKRRHETGCSADDRQTAVMLACWFCAPWIIAWLTAATGFAPLFLGRYLIGTALAALLWAGLCVARIEPTAARIVAAGVVAAAALWSSGIVRQWREDGRLIGDRRQGWREAVALVNTQGVGDWPVFVRSGFIEADRLRGGDELLLRGLCLAPLTTLYALHQTPDRLFPLPTTGSGDLPLHHVSDIVRAGGAWFVINAPERSQRSIQKAVHDSLRSSDPSGRTWSVRDEAAFGDVWVWRIEALSNGTALPVQPSPD